MPLLCPPKHRFFIIFCLYPNHINILKIFLLFYLPLFNSKQKKKILRRKILEGHLSPPCTPPQKKKKHMTTGSIKGWKLVCSFSQELQVFKYCCWFQVNDQIYAQKLLTHKTEYSQDHLMFINVTFILGPPNMHGLATNLHCIPSISGTENWPHIFTNRNTHILKIL